jgi:hypothetical protein
VNLHSSTRIPYSIVDTVGDEPYAHCWSIACFLPTEVHLPPLIDTDSLPPNGGTPHPIPSPPLHGLGTGSYHPARWDHGLDQEGSGSCVREHDDVVPTAQDPSATTPLFRLLHGLLLVTKDLRPSCHWSESTLRYLLKSVSLAHMIQSHLAVSFRFFGMSCWVSQREHNSLY